MSILDAKAGKIDSHSFGKDKSIKSSRECILGIFYLAGNAKYASIERE